MEQMLEYQRPDVQGFIVGALSNALQNRLRDVLVERDIRELRQSPQGLQCLTRALMQEAVYLGGQTMMEEASTHAAEQLGVFMLDSVQRNAKSFAEEIVDSWIDHMRVYIPVDQSHGKRMYDNEKKRREGTSLEQRPHDHMPELQQIVDERFGCHDPTYETLRTATFRAGTVDDVPEIVDMYRSALLRSETLALLERYPGDTQEDIMTRIQRFRAEMNKGKFIWDVKTEDMRDDLNGRSVEQTGMEFRIRLLEALDGRKLAFMTYLHNPRHATPKERKKMRRTVLEYLRRGVTGKMKYDDSTPLKQFEEDAERSELFLDIRSRYPGSAIRLGARGYEEMQRDNHHINHVFAYRAYDMHVQPELSLVEQTREQGILPVINDSSGELFRTIWRFRHIAFDRNPKQGKHWAVRENVAGVDRKIGMKWDVMVARLNELVPRAREKWRRHQVDRGDVSLDY